MNITADNMSSIVTDTFMDCLFKDGELVDGKPQGEYIAVEGLTRNIGFNPERLQAKKQVVKELLRKLPEEFKESVGGGWSFLNFCKTKEGEQWTGMHLVCEQLVCLGLGLKLLGYLMPREMWKFLPGGVPYIVIKDEV